MAFLAIPKYIGGSIGLYCRFWCPADGKENEHSWLSSLFLGILIDFLIALNGEMHVQPKKRMEKCMQVYFSSSLLLQFRPRKEKDWWPFLFLLGCFNRKTYPVTFSLGWTSVPHPAERNLSFPLACMGLSLCLIAFLFFFPKFQVHGSNTWERNEKVYGSYIRENSRQLSFYFKGSTEF